MPIEKQERGIGDTILNFNKKIGVAHMADAIAKLSGYEDCGCEERAEALNDPNLLINKIFYKNKDEESNT